MNRFKKELTKNGFKLEQHYDWMPYEVADGIYIEAVCVNSEAAMVTFYYNVIVQRLAFNRAMVPTDVLDPNDVLNF